MDSAHVAAEALAVFVDKVALFANVKTLAFLLFKLE
jgi:hypothetical protein